MTPPPVSDEEDTPPPSMASLQNKQMPGRGTLPFKSTVVQDMHNLAGVGAVGTLPSS